jgi:hypothetical protein
VRVDLVGARRAESFIDLLADLPFVEGARVDDGALYVEVRDPRGDNPDLVQSLVAAGARITGIREEAVTLEQVYLGLVGEAGERDARVGASTGLSEVA